MAADPRVWRPVSGRQSPLYSDKSSRAALAFMQPTATTYVGCRSVCLSAPISPCPMSVVGQQRLFTTPSNKVCSWG